MATADQVTGTRLYWEHLGMLEDLAYAQCWERKRAVYCATGILPHAEGAGPTCMLVTSRDEPGGTLDSAKIAKLIDEVVRDD